MRKKIAIFTYSLAGGGAERMVANILHSLDRNKYEIHPVLMNTNIAYNIPADQTIHFIERSNTHEWDLWKLIKLPFLAYRFAKYCKKNEIELVFAFMNRPNMVATIAKAFGLKAKVLISERFYTPYFYNNSTIAGRLKDGCLKKAMPKRIALCLIHGEPYML
jgi:N-acetylgalactosamine-N,N'-diacetylbacillosaminyl-diphospho-undecaprenol 4-alpha-N-acetylgalactosaminyltransferase